MRRVFDGFCSVPQKKVTEERKTSVAPLQRKKAAAVLENDGKRPWTKKAIREICVFLILFKVTVTSCMRHRIRVSFRFVLCARASRSLRSQLWIILASGVQPQLENGLRKQFFGFSARFVAVNLGQFSTGCIQCILSQFTEIMQQQTAQQMEILQTKSASTADVYYYHLTHILTIHQLFNLFQS